MTSSIAADEDIFAVNASITNPSSARRFRIGLDLLRHGARFLPFLPGAVSLGKVYYIPGHDDALDALASDSVFATPYKARMQTLDTNGQVSLLGFDQTEDAAYRKNLCEVMRAMPLDMAAKLAALARAETEKHLAKAGARFDLMSALLVPVTLRVTQEFYGVTFRDGAAFLQWTMAILVYVFGPPGGAAYKRLAAEAAGRLLDAEIQRNIQNFSGRPDSVLGAMLASGMAHQRIQATLAALLVGGMPTLTEGGYNIMQVLLSERKAMAMARDAAGGDDAMLGRCLGEALRFRPVLPVIFRKCVRAPMIFQPGAAARVEAAGPVDWRGRPIPAGADVGIVCMTANFDGRGVTSPWSFDPTRKLSDSLSFGQGKHWCLGVPFAMAILVNVFGPLLRRGVITGPAKAAKTRYFLDYFGENFEISIERDE